jgi:hypothetical protein
MEPEEVTPVMSNMLHTNHSYGKTGDKLKILLISIKGSYVNVLEKLHVSILQI